MERARLLIEQAEALGEPPEDPLLLFSVLYGFWIANFVAFDGDVLSRPRDAFLGARAEATATATLMIGHRLMGLSLLFCGDIAESRAHLDRAIALYDAAEQRPLATRFGADVRVSALSYRSLALWLLGYPEAALADSDEAISDAREIGQAASLMYALCHVPLTHILCGNNAAANAQANEVVALADEKGALFWKARGMLLQGWLLALTGKASDAVQMIASGITAIRSTGATRLLPIYLAHLARAHAELGLFDDAWRCVGEAMTAVETTKEKWCEAEIHRSPGK